ncbi:MAG: GNAT family N-acetyltransferase [Pseudomonadota bacterium]
MRPVLRLATREDSATCWHIFQRAVHEGAAAHYSDAQRQAWAPEPTEPPWIADRLAEGQTWIADVAASPERAGTGAARPSGFLTAEGLGGDGDALLDLFFVLPEARRTGVADALYRAFADAAAAAGQGGRMTAHASLLLRPFLARRGWQVIEEEWVERGGVMLNRFRMEGPGAER